MSDIKSQLKKELIKQHIVNQSLQQNDIDVAPEVSPLESGLRGAAQGASLGFADELTGAGEAGLDTVTGKSDLSNLIEAYKKHRDESRAAYKAAEEANPKSYLAGNIIGGIAPVAASGGLGAGVQGAARLGALAGAGASNTDLTSDQSIADKSKGLMEDMSLGGATAAGVAAIPGAVGALKNTLPGKVFSSELAGKPIVGEAARRKIGQEAVETAGNIGNDVQKALDAAAQNKTNILKEMTEQGQKFDISPELQQLPNEIKQLPESFTSEADSARKALQEPFERAKDLSKNIKEQTPTKDIIDDTVSLDPKQLDSLRRALGRLGYEKDLKDDQVIALAKRLSGKLSDKLNSQVNPVTGEITQSPLGAANKKIQDLISAQDIFNTGGKGIDDLGMEKKITPLLQRLESDSVSSDVARSQFQKGIQALKQAEPELGTEIEKQAMDVANRFDMTRDVNKPITISREGGKRAAQIGAGYLGRGLNAADQALGEAPSMIGKPVVETLSPVTQRAGIISTINQASDLKDANTNSLTKKMSQMNPDQLRSVAQRLRGQPGLDAVAKKVDNAAQTNDPVSKAQAEFVIQQNPNAKRLLENPNEE